MREKKRRKEKMKCGKEGRDRERGREREEERGREREEERKNKVKEEGPERDRMIREWHRVQSHMEL